MTKHLTKSWCKDAPILLSFDFYLIMQGPMHGAFVGNFNKVRPLIAVQLRTFNMYYTVNFIYLADAGLQSAQSVA